MLKLPKFITICFTAILLLSYINNSFENSIYEVKQLINDQKYTEAFDSLNILNDNTAEGLYLKGLCMYYLNKDLNEAIVILSKSLSANGPDRIKLILGLIYHKQYKTIEAKKFLNEFLPLAKTSEDKEMALLYLNYCQNINAVAHRGKNIQIKGLTNISETDLSLYYNQQNLNTVIVPKSFELNTREDEQKDDLNTLMVLPKDASNTKYVYYSAYVPGRTDHSDIFRVKVLENGEFSEPDDLGSVINTNYDEKFPYFDNENQVLYFASKGHQSIGGYDIFMSYYNIGAESWSKPINLGLPFNSTGDDLLYLQGSADNEYFFATNRNSDYGFFDVVNIFIPPGAGYKTLISPNDIEAFNSLNINSAAQSAPDLSDSKNINDPTYKLLIEKALYYQVRADSIKRRVHEQHQKIDVALGENRKAQLRTDLKMMERDYKNMQDKANVHYDAVREWEIKNNITTPQVQVKPAEEINNIQVYEYTPPVTATQPVNDKPVKVTEPKTVPHTTPTVINTPQQPAGSLQKEYSTTDDLPNGIIFTVQIGVFSKVIEKENFNGLKDVFYYFITDRKLYKYNTGVFTDIEKAKIHLIRAKESGFSDAFVTAYNSGKPISLEKAIEILQNN